MTTPPAEGINIANLYPSGKLMKLLYRSPLLLYRLGLGKLVGRLFMVITTTGRKSGLPRRAVVEFHTYNGRKYVYSGWGGRAQWYKNLQADPLVTIQTAHGAESVIARRLTEDDELREAFDFVGGSPYMQAWFNLLGAPVTMDNFLAHRDQLYLITFDPTDEPTPPPLEADLTWVWSVLGTLAGILIQGYFKRRKDRCCAEAPPANPE